MARVKKWLNWDSCSTELSHQVALLVYQNDNPALSYRVSQQYLKLMKQLLSNLYASEYGAIGLRCKKLRKKNESDYFALILEMF